MKQSLKTFAFAAMMVAIMGFSGSAWAAITVTAVTPNLSDITGGETVSVAGTGFSATTTVVRFGSLAGVGGVPGTNFFVVSATEISVTTPAHAKGVVEITVVDTGGNVSLASALTYTKSNRVLQVSVKMTLAKNVSIAWADNTSDGGSRTTTTPDDATQAHVDGDITPYYWRVKDAETGNQIQVGDTYISDDATNAKTLVIKNTSATGSNVKIDATASYTVPTDDTVALDLMTALAGATGWTVSGGAASGADQIAVLARMLDSGTGANVALAAGAARTLSVAAGLPPYSAGAADATVARLRITIVAPTSAAATSVSVGAAPGTAVRQTSTVSLVATAL